MKTLTNLTKQEKLNIIFNIVESEQKRNSDIVARHLKNDDLESARTLMNYYYTLADCKELIRELIKENQ